jgi:cytidylate kinase
VTEAIREPRVSEAVSGIARVPAVRQAVNALFRSMVSSSGRPGVVVEGRDITTVVASDSTVVDFLTAAPGVEVVDSTHLDFDQTVDAVIGVIRTNVPAQTGAHDGI